MALYAALLDLNRVVLERVDDDGCYVARSFGLVCKLWLTTVAAAGLSTAEIADHMSLMPVADTRSLVRRLRWQALPHGRGSTWAAFYRMSGWSSVGLMMSCPSKKVDVDVSLVGVR